MNVSDTERLKAKELARNISKSIGIIEQLANAKVEYYYCPTNDTSKAARAAKYAKVNCVRCSSDLLSARGDSKSILERAKTSANGSCIIAFTPTVNMISALPEVFRQYRSQQLEIVPVFS